MAVRTITTRLALDGEAQFKQAMTSVNASLRAMKSEIALSEAQFKGQANTVEALTAKDKLLRKEIEQQTEKVKALSQALQDAAQVYGEDSNQVSNYQAQLNRAKTDLVNMNQALNENTKYLWEARNSADGTAKSIDGFGNATKGAGDSVNMLASALKAAGVAAALHEIAGAIRSSIDASMEFETAMANFNKVAKLNNRELSIMADQIKQLSTEIPATTSEIAQVAEASVRLGIAKKHVLQFTRVMIDLGNVSDLSSDQAATALARFANITRTAAEDYSRLGSTVVALGNNFATSESEITNMSSRLAAAGKLAGLSESQIMGLAAAMSSVGIEAEAGGTAMTQTLTAMEKAVTSGGEKLELLAQVAGMSSQAFSDAWANEPITAIQAFIGGLAGLDEKGESATQVLDDLGISGVQQANMLKSLALANETLVDAVALANRAWDENTELTETAAEKYATAQAKLDMAANAANNLKIAVGDALRPALGALAEGVTPVLGVIETVIKDNPLLVQGITAVVTVLGLLTAGMTAYNIIAPLAATATGALAAALHLLPFVGVATAIGVAVAGLNSFVKWLTRANEEAEAFTQAADAMDGAAAALAESMGGAVTAALEESGALNQLKAAAGDAGPLLEELAARSEELEEATLYLAGANDTLSAALEEQSSQGRLSLQTALDLIDAGYGAAIAVDEETGAVTLNREEYIRLASAKIQEQIATLEAQKSALEAAAALDDEAAAARRDSSAYWEAAAAKAAKTAADKDDIKSLDAQIAALKAAQSSLGSYTGAAESSARRTASASRQVKTQAQQDLEAYKQMKAELDHQKAVDLVDEAEYYRQMAEYRDQYLTDDANVSEYRKVTEQIYKYDKSLADQEAELWADQTDALISELEERIKSVSGQQDKMEDRLSGYGDLFEVKDNNLTLNSIQDQIDAINDYEEALTRLKERNISGGLMNEVLNLDVDSATQYARELLEMSEEQWEEYNNLWDEKQQRAMEVAEQFFKDQLDVLETEYNDKLGAALDNLTDTSYSSGVDTAQGLIDGLASQEEALYAQAQRMAEQVSNILAGAGRIPSNSELAASFSTDRIAERFQGVTPAQMQNAVVGGVNALNTASAGASYSRVDVTLELDGQVLARKQVDPMRQAFKERPETLDDK
ncbi:phage tail tape measure protein [Colidextribacter sp. OB.20]|uniref:phage tail tape measure protein n=1 Tax=Colidextribacter sp. OB.20 TaxID=2304568 RepID=UPI00136A70CD|nr:phage tail tape measure protein [Colidextribacter sp. OB.20]NBI08650.1 phage tail tape measure protein [Colidextribacter sp. OB.20]